MADAKKAGDKKNTKKQSKKEKEKLAKEEAERKAKEEEERKKAEEEAKKKAEEEEKLRKEMEEKRIEEERLRKEEEERQKLAEKIEVVPDEEETKEEKEEVKLYEYNGKHIKPKLVNSDVTNNIKNRAFALGFDALNKFTSEKEMSEYIKEIFDNEFEPEWQIVIGKDFSVAFSFEIENFIFFQIEDYYFLYYKL